MRGRCVADCRVDAMRAILPQEKANLTAFFDRAEVDAEADLLNWHAFGRDLRKK